MISIKKHEMMDKIINTIEDGMIAIDNKGIIFIFNNAAERLLSINNSEAIGKHVNEVLINSELINVLKTGEKQINQQKLIKSKSILINRVPIHEGNELLGAVSLFRDITRSQQLLDQRNSYHDMKVLLEAIFNTTRDAISVSDENGMCIMYNPAYAKIAEISNDEFLNKPIDFFQAPGQGNSIHLQVIKTKKAIASMKMRVGKANKSVLVNAAPLIVNNILKGSVAVIHDISEIKKLTEELEITNKKIKTLESKYTFDSIIGVEKILTDAVEQAKIAAQTNVTVLLLGESGTGKELFAHSIHNASERRNKPFIRINCAAINDQLFESELFGYVGGAFTGSKHNGHKGLFEEANEGSIFLDEIGELGLQVQSKLLRVLQEKEIIRVGDTKPIPINVRIIAATNSNLKEKIMTGDFREDLFFRLNLFPIRIPSLREHKKDIALLANSILNKFNKEYGRNVTEISSDVLNLFNLYNWPGNVRELENVIGHAMILMNHNESKIETCNVALFRSSDNQSSCKQALSDIKNDIEFDATYNEQFDDWEKEMLKQYMKNAQDNRTLAARRLNISVRTLYNKLKRHGI